MIESFKHKGLRVLIGLRVGGFAIHRQNQCPLGLLQVAQKPRRVVADKTGRSTQKEWTKQDWCCRPK
jgi:hypothetical protein